MNKKILNLEEERRGKDKMAALPARVVERNRENTKLKSRMQRVKAMAKKRKKKCNLVPSKEAAESANSNFADIEKYIYKSID